MVVPAGYFPARKNASSPFLAPMDEEGVLGEAAPRMEVLA